MGAFECGLLQMAPTYPQGDVMYVSKNGSDQNDGSSWSNAMASPEQAIINAARGNPRTLMVGSGTYDIKGRVMLYIQKDGFSGGIWAGVVLAEGMKIYGGVKADQAGSAQEQINSRAVGRDPWNFGSDATVLRGTGLERPVNEEGPMALFIEEAPSNREFNPDYLGIWGGADWTQPEWEKGKEKDTTRVTNGIRLVTQVEDFDESSGTKVDGVDLQNGYVISRKEAKPSWPGVKKANYLGGGGILIRGGARLDNSIVEHSYEATLAILGDICGGGVMVSGGSVSKSLIKDNICETSGGGIFIASGKIEDCAVENNVAFNMGGGIVTSHGPGTATVPDAALKPSSIIHTAIKGNKAIGTVPIQTNRFGIPYPYDPNEGRGIGGGAWIANNVLVDGAIFDGNRSKNGGDGLYVGTRSSTVAQAIIENSLFTNHSDGDNQAVFMETGSLLDSDVIKNKNPIAVSSQNNAIVSGTVFWQNQNEIPAGINMTYSAMPGGYGEQSAMNLVLSDDNSGVSGPNFVNPNAGDYHLLSSSPLIDRNSPDDPVDHDYDMISRPQGSATDIGMFEYANIQKTGDDNYVLGIVLGCALLMIFSIITYYFLSKKRKLRK